MKKGYFLKLTYLYYLIVMLKIKNSNKFIYKYINKISNYIKFSFEQM